MNARKTSNTAKRPQKPEELVLPGVETEYWFSVEAAMSATTQASSPPGPMGQRIHFVYKSNTSRVWTKPLAMPPSNNTAQRERDRSAVEGTILSGGDFALLRLDGVLELDGRMTLKTHDGVLVDAAYSGIVDLDRGGKVDTLICDAVNDEKLNEQVHAAETQIFESHADGKIKAASTPILLCVSFETASMPWTTAPGEDLSWVKDRYIGHRRKFWQYRRLARRPFIAAGNLHCVGSFPNGITGIDVDILALKARTG